MARVTVEDCIDKVDNRFDLVLLAAHRARMISSGSQLTVDRDNDKNPVVSLREIADSTISPEDLREELVHSLQKFVEVDEPEPDTVPLIGSAGASVDADDTEVAVEAEIVHEGSGYAMVKGRVLIGKKAVADAEMTLRMLPIPNQEFADALHKRARELGLMVQA